MGTGLGAKVGGVGRDVDTILDDQSRGKKGPSVGIRGTITAGNANKREQGAFGGVGTGLRAKVGGVGRDVDTILDD